MDPKKLRSPWCQMGRRAAFLGTTYVLVVFSNQQSVAMESDNNGVVKTLEFIVDNGKTYFSDCNGRQVFGDFSLKLQGQLQVQGESSAYEKEKCGYWVASCTSKTCGRLETKTIVIPANAFDSKARFLHELRSRFGSGILNLGGGVTASNLADYYSFLKGDLINPRKFYKASHLGFQEDSYWLLSRELHFSGKQLVSPREQAHYVADNDLLQFETFLGPHLLSQDVIKDVSRRFIQLSQNFGINQIPFLLGTAFVLYNNIKPILKYTMGKSFADESSIGIIFSPTKNIGKNLTLRLLALAQGITSPHPLFCSGGDQNISGVSVKVLMSTIASSTLTCLIDDPLFTPQLSEWLLQVQGGLPQGSLRTGFSIPAGNVLISSNSRECSRIHGRSIVLNYQPDAAFHQGNDVALNTEFLQLLERNKGFLLAWVILFWEHWVTRQEELRTKIKSILEEMMQPAPQPRWENGVSGVLYTYCIFHEVATGAVVPPNMMMSLIRHLISSGTVSGDDGSRSFWKRLENEVKAALEVSKVPLTWLNPCVNVNVGGKFIPAIGITCNQVSNFTSIGNKETKQYLKERTDSSTPTTAMNFAVNEKAKIMDIRKKTNGLVKTAKGYKVPKDVLEQGTVHLIEYACGLREDEPSATTPTTTSNESAEVETPQSVNELIEMFRTRIETDMATGTTGNTAATAPPSVMDELSPASKLSFNLLTPGKKDSFIKGVWAGIKLATGNRGEIEEGEASAVETRPPKRRLFSTEGAIGLRPCARKVSRYSKDVEIEGDYEDAQHDGDRDGQDDSNGDYVNDDHCDADMEDNGNDGVADRKDDDDGDDSDDDDLCGSCMDSTPPSKTTKMIRWIQCDGCQKWYHMFCVKLKSMPKKTWNCRNCNIKV